MQDDLDLLMGNLLEENSTIESPEILNNVTLLDDEKNEPKVNLRAPGAILDDYTMLDLDNQKIDIEYSNNMFSWSTRSWSINIC